MCLIQTFKKELRVYFSVPNQAPSCSLSITTMFVGRLDANFHGKSSCTCFIHSLAKTLFLTANKQMPPGSTILDQYCLPDQATLSFYHPHRKLIHHKSSSTVLLYFCQKMFFGLLELSTSTLLCLVRPDC